MFKRLLQAATITFLLNLLAYLSPPETNQSTTVSPQPLKPKLMLSFR